MKYKKALGILSLLIVVAMLVMAVPATAQTRFIELDPEEGTIGSTVVVVGEGFNQSTETTDKYAVMYFSSEEASTIDDIDSDVTVYEVVRDGIWLDEDGTFEVDFTIPDELNDGEDEDDYEDVTSGTYYVYVCHYLSTSPPTVATRIRAVAEFTVIGGELGLDPEEGPVGTEVEVSGLEFAANEDITVYYDDEEIDIESGDKDTDSDGEFVNTILIPESTAGVHTIKVAVGGSEAEAEFTVESDVVLEPTSGEAGNDVLVSGTGFAKRSDVVVYFNNAGVATGTTSSDGSFEANFTVPELDAGIYDVEAEDEDENLDTAKFTITAAEPTQPTQPAPSDLQTVKEWTGSGTKTTETFTITTTPWAISWTNAPEVIDGQSMGILQIMVYDAQNPDFPLTIAANTGEKGSDTSYIHKTGTFYLTINAANTRWTAQLLTSRVTSPAAPTSVIDINPKSAKVGSNLIVTGAGFATGGAVTIKFDDAVLDTITADANGMFVSVVKVPSAKAGEHTITVSDGINTNEIAFTLEAVPPPIPTPLKPQMGVKAKTPVLFDWEDVSAEAEPVTYSLQVATSDGFDEDTIVLEKTELADSEYATTEAESIALAGREDVYYWRIRAVDAASTEGEWTGAGEFYVRKPFSFPKWATYTLLGLGALVLFGVGYWMGRRTAYYY